MTFNSGIFVKRGKKPILITRVLLPSPNLICSGSARIKIQTGSDDTFAHETKITAKSAITANNYNRTVTFIVSASGGTAPQIKNKHGCT